MTFCVVVIVLCIISRLHMESLEERMTALQNQLMIAVGSRKWSVYVKSFGMPPHMIVLSRFLAFENLALFIYTIFGSWKTRLTKIPCHLSSRTAAGCLTLGLKEDRKRWECSWRRGTYQTRTLDSHTMWRRLWSPVFSVCILNCIWIFRSSQVFEHPRSFLLLVCSARWRAWQEFGSSFAQFGHDLFALVLDESLLSLNGKSCSCLGLQPVEMFLHRRYNRFRVMYFDGRCQTYRVATEINR